MRLQKIILLACCASLPAFFIFAPPEVFQPQPAFAAHGNFSASQFLSGAAQDTAAAPPAKYFIAIFSLGPAWQKDRPAHEQLYFKEHSANLRKWREEKKITLGARYSDKGMIVLSARDEAEARAWLENDPMVVNQVFNLEIYPFNPFYTGCIEKK